VSSFVLVTTLLATGASLTGETVTTCESKSESKPGSVAVNVIVSKPFQFSSAENVTMLLLGVTIILLSACCDSVWIVEPIEILIRLFPEKVQDIWSMLLSTSET